MDIHHGFVFVVPWHSGDGTHVYDHLSAVIDALRRQPYRDATVTVVNWRTGARAEFLAARRE